MKTDYLPGEKVNIITLGCSKNLVDSEYLIGHLKANGIETQHETEKINSGIVIINTCGFIENAKQESIDTILQFVQAKKQGLIRKLLVTGCLVQRYKEELRKELPEVDNWFGTEAYLQIVKTLKTDFKQYVLGERVLTTPKHYAFLKISEGCNRNCSFCAIPLIRGKHKSIPIKELLHQARKLAKGGVKELILIAQDITYYGLDIYGKRSLNLLLDQLAGIKGIEWIRIHYAFPEGFPEEILDTMNRHPEICRYIDIPLQHISDRILSSMKRGSSKQKINRLIKRIREKVEGIAIRTTIITGYPRETESEFNELLEWIEEMKFERLGVFTYSHEEGTSAYQLTDDVPENVKNKRAESILLKQADISLNNNRAFIGKVLPVIIDRKEGNELVGRTQYDSPDVDNEVIIPCNNYKIFPGDIVNTRITECDSYTLTGEFTE